MIIMKIAFILAVAITLWALYEARNETLGIQKKEKKIVVDDILSAIENPWGEP